MRVAVAVAYRAPLSLKSYLQTPTRVTRRRTASASSNGKPVLHHVEVKSFAIGSLAGMLGSLAGMGGGFIMIPLMTGWMRISQHQAHGTSLFAVAATGLAGAISYSDQVQVPEAMAVAATAMITSRLGAQTTIALSAQTLRRALGVLMLCMAPVAPLKARYYSSMNQDSNRDETASPPPETTMARFIPPAVVGLASGYLSGLFGVGGGVIVVPALTLSCPDCTHKQALATSLAAMTLPALLGTYTHYVNGTCALAVAPYLALGALTGAYVGGKVSLRTEEDILRWGFSGLLTVLGLRTLMKA